MMSPRSIVAPMLAVINTAMSQTRAITSCLLACRAPSHGNIVFQQMPEIRRNAQANPCGRAGDLEDAEVVHVSLQSPTPQEAQP
jgi:hypothetical protein